LSLTFSVLAATFGCSAAQPNKPAKTIFKAIDDAGGYATLLSFESTEGDVLLGTLGSNVSKYEVCIISRLLPS
jgi:hypothetical protein